jgi:hypothetical protein
MKNIHQPILDIMKYYAAELGSETVKVVMEKQAIESEDEAKEILIFLDEMCSKVSIDAKDNVVVLNQPIHTSDAEKVCDVIEDYIEVLGYGNLID